MDSSIDLILAFVSKKSIRYLWKKIELIDVDPTRSAQDLGSLVFKKKKDSDN